MTQAIAEDHVVAAVPRDLADVAGRELVVNGSNLSNPTLKRMREQLGVRKVLYGYASGLVVDQNGVRLSFEIQDTETGDLVSISELGSTDNIDDLVARILIRMRVLLSTAQRSLPSRMAHTAEILYGDAESRLQAWDALGARHALEQAIALAPNHGPLHSALSVAWRRLGWDVKARQSARRGLELSVGLADGQRLLAEARYAEAWRDWTACLNAYRRLRDLFPENFEYGLGLAEAQWRLGESRAMQNTLHVLTSDASTANEPRLLILRALSAQGNLDEMRTIARRARESAEQRNLPFVAAEAAVVEAYSLHASRRRANAFAPTVQYAERIYEDAGDEVNFLSVGLRAGSSRVSNKAKSVFDQVGSDRGQLLVQYRIAEAHHRASRLSLARQALNEADSTLERLGGLAGDLLPIPPRGLSPTSLRAWLEYDAGDIDAARRIIERSRGTSAVDDVPLTDIFPYVLILCEQGEVGSARRVAESGILRARLAADQLHLSRAVHALGRVSHLEGRLNEALRLYRDYVELAAGVGIKTRPWEIVVALADRGDLGEAERQAELVQQMYRNAKNADRELGGVTAYLRILLVRNRMSEAQRAGERARMLATGTESSRVRLRVRIDLAVLDAALGRRAHALNQVREIVAEAQRRRLVQTELDARLAMCRIAGGSAEDIARVRADAEAKGFGLIARDAARLGRP